MYMSLRKQRQDRQERIGNMCCVAMLWDVSLWGAWQIAIRQPDPEKTWCMAAVGQWENWRSMAGKSPAMQLPVGGSK